MIFTPMIPISYAYTALALLLAKLYLNQVYAAPTEGFPTVFSKVPKPSEGGEKQSGSRSLNILSPPTPVTDPHAKSSTSTFDTPQHSSEPQESQPLAVPHRRLLSTGDAYPRAENPLDAGFASLLHGDRNSPLRGEKGDLVSSSSIHRNDSPLPSIEPQVREGGHVKSSSQRKRKPRTGIPGSSAQPGMTELTEVPQDAIHSSPQKKRKVQSKIQQSSAQPGTTDQSHLTEVAQHPEGDELHGNQSDSDQERVAAAPGSGRWLKGLERARQQHKGTMHELNQILDFTDGTLHLDQYATFSAEIMGRIAARVDDWVQSGERGDKRYFTAESVKQNVEKITKISTYYILQDISMLKTDTEEIITDKEEVEKVLLFLDIFWQKIYARTLQLNDEFTWIPLLTDRMDPNLFRIANSKSRKGAYFWIVTSKEIHTFWLIHHGKIAL